ncbi:hypothetical protein PCANC_11032 [Puccinia coronata f. sp. avenae]|uniref:Core-binding (CB) domain-containing protein n=1 Tax=Puccinia coronata f. sp. avenae TaxID=200324 RepID=A0A2N5UW98_9BASI|nr:hypothetical protein PCANC_11032 [Puccinia coronata f. sp. avenae]
MNFQQIAAFLRNGTEEQTITAPDIRVLSGWSKSTLVSYNAAVKKFVTFKKESKEGCYRLPITTRNVYEFVTWAGWGEGNKGTNNILASSLTKYLHGLKAWHTFHNADYPHATAKRVKLMLKASGQQDA